MPVSQETTELARAIVAWSERRPIWERHALRLMARAEPITSDIVTELADMAEQESSPTANSVVELTVEELAPDSTGIESVNVVSISSPRSVNALTWDDGLAFAGTGLTLVYGENGSGKSGYARILKKVTRARSNADVLSNVFETPAAQSAALAVAVGSNEPAVLNWPTESPGFLSRVSFFDSDCLSRYISADTEVAYRPSTIVLLDNLVSLSGRVRQELEQRKSTSQTQAPALPQVVAGTRAAEFLAGIGADTTALDIDLASEVPSDVDGRLVGLRERISNMETVDSSKRLADLRQLESAAANLRNRIGDLRSALSDASVAELRVSRGAAEDARLAADAASASQFETLPLDGVGSSTWRLLWEAARRFSEAEAYPGKEFPFLGDRAHEESCVLCQQALADDARERLAAFDAFVSTDTERIASEAELKYERLASAKQELIVLDTSTELWLQRVFAASEPCHTQIRSELEALDSRREAIVRALADTTLHVEPLEPPAELDLVEVLNAETAKMIEDLSTRDPAAQLSELRAQEAELLGRLSIVKGRDLIDSRIAHERKVRVVDEAIRLTDTRGITRQAADLTRTHVSDVLKHRFSQETLRLGLEKVRLADAGGGQGNLKHRAQLVDAVQSAPLRAVLSEGEQTALGLAGFLTEVESDQSRSAVVFDDPVTSLDHVRQERVARRIVELGTRRQVIIFTHDIGFVVDLKRAAEAASVDVTEKWVTKVHTDVGRVSEGGPWDSKTVGQRLNDLRGRLGDVRSVYQEANPDATHEVARSWYAELRLVWERALEEVVLGPVLVRGRLELRPGNMKVLVKFDANDDKEFQAAFTRCGDRGSHDRSSQLNRPLPPVSELEADLELLHEWHKRVKKYQS